MTQRWKPTEWQLKEWTRENIKVKIVKDSWIFAKQLVSGQASREVYLLFAIAKLGAFLCGVLIGKCVV